MKRYFKFHLQFFVWVMVISLIATPVWGKPLTNDQQFPEAASQDVFIESVGAPVNDIFANATVITGESGTASGHNIEATLEVDETTPWSQFYDVNSSVWWSWQAPSDGTYAFDSTGDFYNYLFVYTGTSVNALTALAGNEYVDYDFDTIDRIVFKATAGVTYHIAVYGDGLSQGSIELAWSKVIPPLNDDFANAILINTAAGTEFSSNINATVEPDEAYYLYDPGDGIVVNSVWYQWTAPATGSYTFDTNDSGMTDTMLEIFTGTSFDTLVSLYQDDDDGIYAWSMIRMDATAGTSYFVCVTGYWGFKGEITLNWFENLSPSITSLNAATFTVGTAETFTVTATGLPEPVVTLTAGSLPAGVAYNSSTKTLSGTPATGTGGVYNLVFTAANGIGSNATQNFTLTVNEAPSITSTSQATFAIGVPAAFSLVTRGYPAPTVELTSGSLPDGITYDSATRQLGGMATGTAGTYALQFTAANGVGTPAIQNFWLITLFAAPEITEQPHSLMATTSDLATFSVIATGSPVLTYQWQVCTSARKNIWTDLAGATSSTYSTPQATLKMDGYQYRVIVANSAGSVTSDPATLTVYDVPTSQTNVEIDVAGTYDPVSKTIEWTISVSSLGPENADAVQVTATLAKFSRFVSADLTSIPGATYKVQGSKVMVNLGTLSGYCQFSLSTDVSRATSPTALTVSATTTSFDSDLTNNTATDEVVWP